MVKNTKGGSGHKGQARKFANITSSKKTRVSEDDMEIYACVTGLLGGAICSVKCVDGEDRMCIIRGKFRGGRGKRGNMLSRGTWVLIGAREWSSESGSDKESRKCDLLEVYSDTDKIRLRETVLEDWNILDSNDVSRTTKEVETGDAEILFASEKDEDRERLAAEMESATTEKIVFKVGENTEEEEVYFDDI